MLSRERALWTRGGARANRLEAEGDASGAVARRLGLDERRWEEIVRACSMGVVPLGHSERV
ncbi:MAG: hypothetical protein ACK41W_14920 [Cyanobacteriota bacterium]